MNFIKKLYDKIFNIFPYDKNLHFIAGMALAVPGIMLFGISINAVIPAIVVGIAKEVYDYFHMPKYHPELADAACTAFGSLLIVLLMGYIV